MTRFGIGFAALLTLAGLQTALGDVLTLQNGDQLRGKVVREQGDTLIFKADLFPQTIEIPLDSISSIASPPVDAPPAEESPAEQPKPAKQAKPSPKPEVSIETAPPVDPAPLPKKPEEPSQKFKLPENWDARLGLGYSDRQNEKAKNREISAEGTLSWKNKGREAQWSGHYHYQSHEDSKSADRYGVSQRLRHRGEKGFYAQAETKLEVDNVTKKRNQASQTAGLGYSPIRDEKLTVNVTPGFKAEHISNAENEEQNGTAYKAHVHQDLKWKVTDSLSLGQELRYSVDPRRSEDWDMDFRAFVETRVSDDVNLRVNYRRDFLNQAEGADDKESTELGASLVWDF